MYSVQISSVGMMEQTSAFLAALCMKKTQSEIYKAKLRDTKLWHYCKCSIWRLTDTDGYWLIMSALKCLKISLMISCSLRTKLFGFCNKNYAQQPVVQKKRHQLVTQIYRFNLPDFTLRGYLKIDVLKVNFHTDIINQ